MVNLVRERRDPGTGWSHATFTTENIREGSFLIRQFVALSFANSKHYTTTAITHKTISDSACIYSNGYLVRIKQVCLEEIYCGCNVVATFQLGIWRVSHISSCSSVVLQQNQLWTSINAKILSRSNCLFLL